MVLQLVNNVTSAEVTHNNGNFTMVDHGTSHNLFGVAHTSMAHEEHNEAFIAVLFPFFSLTLGICVRQLCVKFDKARTFHHLNKKMLHKLNYNTNLKVYV